MKILPIFSSPHLFIQSYISYMLLLCVFNYHIILPSFSQAVSAGKHTSCSKFFNLAENTNFAFQGLQGHSIYRNKNDQLKSEKKSNIVICKTSKSSVQVCVNIFFHHVKLKQEFFFYQQKHRLAISKKKKRKREKNSWVTTPINFFHNCSCGYLLAIRFRMVNIWYKIKPMGCEKEKVIRRGLRRPFIRTKR